MRNITYYFKFLLSIPLKIIIAIMMGLGSSTGKDPVDLEHKNNKTIETEK
jgi:hypothetical protein